MSSMASVRRLRTSASAQRRFSVVLRLIVAVILILFSIFPILWVISASLNPTGSLATQRLIPANPGLDNYRSLLNRASFHSGRGLGIHSKSPQSLLFFRFPSPR
jgi:arabinogalactan oligomer / maltooligosaccharide transport system permease protein